MLEDLKNDYSGIEPVIALKNWFAASCFLARAANSLCCSIGGGPKEAPGR